MHIPELGGPWASALAVLFPDLEPSVRMGPVSSAPAFERIRLFESVARLLDHLSARSPLVVLLDDVQWADPDSLQLLHYAVRNLRTAKVVIVCASRPTTSASTTPSLGIWDDLRRQDLLDLIRLQPLSAQEAAVLLEQTSVSPATARWLGPRMMQWTGGNPFFLLEGTRALIEQGALAPIAARLEWVGTAPEEDEPLLPELPVGIRDTILARVGQVPDETRRLLNVAAVLGRAIDPHLLVQLTGRDEVAIAEALGAAVRAGLLREGMLGSPARIEFAHDLVREAIYSGQPTVLRAAIHRRAAAVLVERGLRGRSVAQHLAAAGEREAAIDHWLEAARTAEAMFAFEEAQRCYAVALDSLPAHDTARRVDVLEKIGRARARRRCRRGRRARPGPRTRRRRFG